MQQLQQRSRFLFKFIKDIFSYLSHVNDEIKIKCQ